MLNILYKDSLIGKKEENQDACLVKSFGNGNMLLAVADGMGGGEMGAELSWRAIELLDEFFVQEVST
jgi:serine/threonine protein phosphatase PrpC